MSSNELEPIFRDLLFKSGHIAKTPFRFSPVEDTIMYDAFKEHFNKSTNTIIFEQPWPDLPNIKTKTERFTIGDVPLSGTTPDGRRVPLTISKVEWVDEDNNVITHAYCAHTNTYKEWEKCLARDDSWWDLRAVTYLGENWFIETEWFEELHLNDDNQLIYTVRDPSDEYRLPINGIRYFEPVTGVLLDSYDMTEI